MDIQFFLTILLSYIIIYIIDLRVLVFLYSTKTKFFWYFFVLNFFCFFVFFQEFYKFSLFFNFVFSDYLFQKWKKWTFSFFKRINYFIIYIIDQKFLYAQNFQKTNFETFNKSEMCNLQKNQQNPKFWHYFLFQIFFQTPKNYLFFAVFSGILFLYLTCIWYFQIPNFI